MWGTRGVNFLIYPPGREDDLYLHLHSNTIIDKPDIEREDEIGNTAFQSVSFRGNKMEKEVNMWK